MHQYDLSGRHAVVTGGAQGFGRAITERFLDSGASVSIWDLDADELGRVARELAGRGTIQPVQVDVSNLDAVDRATQATIDGHGRIDILIGNAGIAGPNHTLWEYPVAEWRRVIEVNLLGLYYTNRAVAPHMIRQGYGRIVNIASVAGKEGNPNASAYSSSKAGVIALTKSLGKELAGHNIAVNVVTPAAAKTRIFDQMTPEFHKFMLSKIPRARFLEIHELASMVTWLASEENSFSTGSVFDISGGRSVYEVTLTMRARPRRLSQGLKPLAYMLTVSAIAVRLGAEQSPAQEPPIFRADVDIIRLDVTVVDKDRRPIRGLTAADFTVTEDGRPQRIVAVTEISAAENDPVLTPRMRYVARDVAANDQVDRLGDGRVFALVLDDFNVPFDDEDIIRSTRETARYVIDGLGPSDVAAVIFTYHAGNTVDFTDDRTKLLEAIDRFRPARRSGFTERTPQGMGPTEGDIVQRWAPSLARSTCDRSQPLASTIETVTRRLSAIPNRRKAVVLMTTGIGLTVGESRGCPGELAARIREAFTVSARTNINIYTVDPAGYRGYENYLQHPMRNTKGIGFPRAMDMMQATGAARQNRDFMKTVAENTGGLAVVATDNLEGEIDRMYAEDGSYYLVGYQSSNSRADGRFRKVSVSVTAPGASVRARSGYFAPREGTLATGQRTRAADSNELGLSGLGNPVGVSLRAAAAVVGLAEPGGSRDGLVTIALAVRYPASAGSVAETLTVTRNLYDADGRAGPPVQEKVPFTLAPAGFDGQRRDLFYALRLAPGRHQVRFEVRSAAIDRSGSVITDIEVPDFTRARLAVSGIVLGTPAGGEVPAPLQGVLPFVPTSEREFTANASPTAFVRVYQAGAAMPQPIRMKVEILNGRDAVVFETSRTLALDAFDASRSATFEATLSFAGLERGPHVLSLTAEAPGFPAVRRDLLFRVR